MKIENLGLYKGTKTRALYTVLKKIKLIKTRPLSGQVTEIEGPHEFQTECGMSLKEKADDLSTFETVNLSGDDELIVKV